MNASARAPQYDLFKLLVAIVLMILFIFLMWGGTPGASFIEKSGMTNTALPSSETMPPSTALSINPGPQLRVSPTMASVTSSREATPTSLTPTVTAAPISSPTGTPTPLPTSTLAISSTPIPSPTITPVISSTATPIQAIPSNVDVCEAASSRSRLQVGMRATILRRLNFRSSPGIQNNWLLTNVPGTKVEVVDGPVCLPHFIGAYLWWQIKLPDGRIGWSAEASMFGSFYFMQPVK